MGQTASSQIHSQHYHAAFPTRHQNQLPRPSACSSSSEYFESDLPDEILALIFSTLSSADRNRCSLVCRRWFAVEGQSRQRLSINASADVAARLPSLLTRFDSITKLALRCDRRSISINDGDLELISIKCPNLTRLKLRSCREITHVGMLSVAKNCKSLRKFSCGSCMFGAKGMNALLDNCVTLEELSVKRLRGASEGFTGEPIGPGSAAGSLKAITLKELYNGQCFGPLITSSKNLKSLKILKCLGDWDRFLESVVSQKNNGNASCGLTEVRLERLQVSDVGLTAVAKCPDLEVFHLMKAPDCSDEGVAAIAENCKLLRKLHIDGWKTNRIGDEGLISVARYCSNIVELVLIGVNLSTLSLMALANGCSKLERLAFCGSETIGDPEITCVASKCIALKKLCIKGCRITDAGIEAFAYGCPNLVKIKVKRCRGVSNEVVDWLRARRVSLSVILDSDEAEREVKDGNTSDGVDFSETNNREAGSLTRVHGVDIGGGGGGDFEAPSTSGGMRPSNKSRFSLFAGRIIVSRALRGLTNGNDDANSSSERL